MSVNRKLILTLCICQSLMSYQKIYSQDRISWLENYSDKIIIGSESYQYNFTNVEANDCKLQIEELFTDKKGKTESKSWIFYLSDIDPSGLDFKAKGKAINISFKTKRNQKFISYYEGGDFEAYTESIRLTMNEVDQSRLFLESIREHIANCKETQVAWANRDEALSWLESNIGEVTDEGNRWEQVFKQGSRNHLVRYDLNAVDSKGKQEISSRTIDLSDIDASKINLKISGKSLTVEVPVKDGKRYIRAESPNETVFENELMIYSDQIESARKIVHALNYLVSNTEPERPQWDSYSASLGFVKDHLGEVTIQDDQFSNSLIFDSSPSGLIRFQEEKSESDGSKESVTYAFYLTDLKENPTIEVSKSSITIKLETKERKEYIQEMSGGKITDYTSILEFHMAEIDVARDIVNAFEVAVKLSEEKIEEFNTVGQTSSWISANVGLIETGGDKYDQVISVSEENNNQLDVVVRLTEDDGESTETRLILYPEDISLEDLVLKTSGSKLSVSLETEKGKYIKKYTDGQLQNFVSSTQILFADPLMAKNFTAAIGYLKTSAAEQEITVRSREEALAFLAGNIQDIDIPDEKQTQVLEVMDEGSCKMSFKRVETDSKGAEEKTSYEFTMSDIDPDKSGFSIKGELVSINLVTRENEKLIKPIKNGEADDFVDDFFIYADDVLLARLTLAAFAILSEDCK